MNNGIGEIISRFLKTRDELTLRNIRKELWSVILIFPLSVILGDLRYFDLKLTAIGFQSYELMLFPLGLGWLVLVFVPRQFIVPLLRLAALCSAILIPFQLLMDGGTGLLAVFMAFQFFNGICAACAFSLFCFELNNVERLFGMAVITFYYGFYFTVWRAFPAVQEIGKTWGGVFVMVIYLAVVYFCCRKKHDELSDTAGDGKGSGAPLVIGLDIVYYMIMCMINYIEWAEKIVYSLPYGLGAFASIVLIILVMLLSNRSALNIWLMFLVFSLFGLSILIYDSKAAQFAGSFVYGLGDYLGYIIIYYLCAKAIKRSKSLKMFKLYCLIFFIEYFVISGIFSKVFGDVEGSVHLLALGIVLVLCSVCFLLIPVLQRKLFDADWTDGIHLHEVKEYTDTLSEKETVNIKNSLNLTRREHEIFIMLLTGMNPKDIAFTLKVSYYTVDFHRKNMYRKLGIQSRAELFAQYSHMLNQTHVN